MNHLSFFQIVLLAASLLSITSCSGFRKAEASSTANTSTTATVAVTRVTRADLSRDIELAAEFRPDQEIDLHSKVSGYLKAIHVDVGDTVRQGQPIAELEVPELAQEINQAVAALKRSELEVERARNEVRRSEAAYGIRKLSYDRLTSVMQARPNLIAQQEIDDLSARYREAEAQFAAAKSAVAVAEEQVKVAAAAKARVDTIASYLKITAPFSGIITSRLADPGAMIQAGTASHTQAMPLVRLSKVDHLRLILPVPESLAARVRIGQPVEVRVDSLSRVFQGSISRFTGKLDSSTRTMETEVDIPNPGLVIKPGMYGYASLRLDQRMDVLSVPVQAVSSNGVTGTVIAVNSHKQLEERKVELGLETPEMLEVRSGLAEGDLVVVGNRNQLKPGMAVETKLVDAGKSLLRGSH
jgi:RND family efflux transporter MFP subunit